MRRKSAFTLIELLVVIAIIALLVSILMPSLQKAKEMAKDVVCRSHQKNVAYAIIMYAEEYDDIFPYTSESPGSNPALTWAIKIGRIADDYDILPYNYRFDEDEHDGDSLAYGKRIVLEGYIDYNYNNEEQEGHFHCPAFQTQVNPKSTWDSGTDSQFSINGNLSGQFEEYLPDPGHWVTKLTDVKQRAVLIGDGNLNPGGNIRVVYTFRTKNDGSLHEAPYEIGDDDWFSFGPWPTQQFVGKWSRTLPCDFPGHPGKKSNLCYTDGSVESTFPIKPNDWKID